MASIRQEEHEAEVRKLENEMMKWVRGELSHWNYYSSANQDPAVASMQCSIADAMEVQKFSLAIQALNTRRMF